MISASFPRGESHNGLTTRWPCSEYAFVPIPWVMRVELKE